MSDRASFELTMTRLIRAPRERVYDAFVSPEALRAWKGPRGTEVQEIAVDPRVGGAWRIVMRGRDGALLKVGGVYCELGPPGRLAYTWQWEEGAMAGVSTLVEVDLREVAGGTLLTLRHSGFPAAPARDGHSRGWNSTVNKLVDLLDPRGSAATLTLYGFAPSSYTRTARLALAEKGIAYTLHECGPQAPELLALNPFGRIPALTDGDFALHETSAIVRYLDESFGGTPLVPETAWGRALCEQWVSAYNAHLYERIVVGYVLPSYFPASDGDGRPDRSPIDAAVKELPATLALIDRGYAANEWIAGGALSMADLFLMPALAYVERLPEGGQLLAPAPHLRRALAAMRRRPSFSATEPSGRFAAT